MAFASDLPVYSKRWPNGYMERKRMNWRRSIR